MMTTMNLKICTIITILEYISQAVSIKEWSLVGRLQGVDTMSGAFNDKEEQFDRLWDGITPKGTNRTKAFKFRQYILEHVRQTRRPLTRANAKKYWMGQLQKEIKESESF